MAFPGTLNINYYRGDTYEFKLYPKDSSGGVFSLGAYDKTTGVKFTISTHRGADSSRINEKIEAYAKISPNSDYISCAIRAGDGERLIWGTDYVYDIQVENSVTSPYRSRITLLTGTITVTEQVTGADQSPGTIF